MTSLRPVEAQLLFGQPRWVTIQGPVDALHDRVGFGEEGLALHLHQELGDLDGVALLSKRAAGFDSRAMLFELSIEVGVILLPRDLADGVRDLISHLALYADDQGAVVAVDIIDPHILHLVQALASILAVGHGELEDRFRPDRIGIEELPLVILARRREASGTLRTSSSVKPMSISLSVSA